MYGTGKVTIFSIFLVWFEIVSTYFCIFLRHSIPSTSKWYWTFLMELDPLVDVEDQLTLVLSLQKSGDVCIYLGTGCRYMSLIWGLSILELGFLFQSSNDHVGSVPSRCSLIVYFAIGVKPECSGICIPPWHAQTNPRFGSHVYSRLVVKPKKHDSKILLVLQHQQRHVMLFLFLFMRSTRLKHMKLFTVKKLCACQDIDPISSKKMSKISDLCCRKRCLAKAECFDWEINTYARVKCYKDLDLMGAYTLFSLMALYSGWLRKGWSFRKKTMK